MLPTDVIRMFGIESILLWTALMTKKRIVVYSESIGALLKVIRYESPCHHLAGATMHSLCDFRMAGWLTAACVVGHSHCLYCIGKTGRYCARSSMLYVATR
jgi:hypothetical protein